MPVVVVVRTQSLCQPVFQPCTVCSQLTSFGLLTAHGKATQFIGVFERIYIMSGIDKLEIVLILAGPVYRLISAVNPVKCYLLYFWLHMPITSRILLRQL
jgi:hypothetical protein